MNEQCEPWILKMDSIDYWPSSVLYAQCIMHTTYNPYFPYSSLSKEEVDEKRGKKGKKGKRKEICSGKRILLLLKIKTYLQIKGVCTIFQWKWMSVLNSIFRLSGAILWLDLSANLTSYSVFSLDSFAFLISMDTFRCVIASTFFRLYEIVWGRAHHIVNTYYTLGWYIWKTWAQKVLRFNILAQEHFDINISFWQFLQEAKKEEEKLRSKKNCPF